MKVSVAVMDFVLVVLGIVAVATGLYFAATLIFGPGEPPAPAGEPLATPLPADRAVTAQDLRASTFPVTARGYRMSDVDALIERLAQQLDRADTPAPAVVDDAQYAPPDEARPEHEPAHAADDASPASDHGHRPAHAVDDDDA